MARWTVTEATVALSARDPVLAGLVERHGPMRLHRAPTAEERFEVLARAIAFQQLSTRAARTIWQRVVDRLGGVVTADALLAVPPDALRACGLSGSKVASVLDLAERDADGRLRLHDLGRLRDEQIVERLVTVRGIGPWTAHMFLISAMRRPDVWPVGDLGVRVGFGRAWLGGRTPDVEELQAQGERFRPWRSVVAWYCWRATEDPHFDA